ncbi:hypothetical protein ABK040_013776 [Willaertia magna]
MLYHPDKNRHKPQEEQQKIKEKYLKITKAYEVLSDDKKKANYDRFGVTDEQDQPSHDGDASPFFHHSSGDGDPFSFHFGGGSPFDDIFSQFFGESAFSGFEGFPNHQQQQKRSGGKRTVRQTVTTTGPDGRTTTTTYVYDYGSEDDNEGDSIFSFF